MAKTAIVTGASRGIGKMCALELAKHFDCVVINSLQNKEMLDTVKQEIINIGASCHAFLGDVSDYNYVKSMIDTCVNETGSIDLLVNNAGISYVGLLTDMSPSDWNNIVNTNLTSVFNYCNTVVPYMVRQKSGHIINISSMWGIDGASCEVAYSATKGGINAFTKALAKELAPSNIRVNAIAPGAVDTDMNNNLSDEEKREFESTIPIGRMANPTEIAQMVYSLYESPAYLTGEVIKIDGGYL
ncbi:MAG: 3-oxoacyl-ACP reductase FabG [Lachnospiraceae bacterium]|nr:3-oxoacyl-ACP reductase FabG [Lachnospiraceae bacterium]